MRKHMKMHFFVLVSMLILVLALSSCGTITSTSTSVHAVKGGSLNENLHQTITTPGIKKMISVAKFTTSVSDRNYSSAYASAAYATLVNKLQATGKFIVFEEKEFETLQAYIQSTGNTALRKQLAQYMIVGSVNSVASKTTGGSFMGISSKTTTVEASVTLRLIDTSTGQIIYSEEGQGDSNNTATGLNYRGFSVSGSGYDPKSLEATAIGAAIDSLIDNIIRTCDEDPWKADIFVDSGNLYIVGGESIGLKAGSVYSVFKRGGTITNPQTGSVIELPGEKVAEATIVSTFPAALPEDEISMIIISNGFIDTNNIKDYVIREK